MPALDKVNINNNRKPSKFSPFIPSVNNENRGKNLSHSKFKKNSLEELSSESDYKVHF